MKLSRSARMSACLIGTLTLIACGKNGSDGSNGPKGDQGPKGDAGQTVDTPANPMNGIFIGLNSYLKINEQRYQIYRLVGDKALIEYGQTFVSGNSIVFEPKGYQCNTDKNETHFNKTQFANSSEESKPEVIGMIEKDLADLEAEQAAIPGEIDAFDSEITTISGEIDALKTQIAESEAPIQAIDVELKTMEEDQKNQNQKATDLNKNIAEIDGKLKKLGSTLANASEDQVDQITEEIKKLTADKETFKTELSSTKEALLQLDQNIKTKITEKEDLSKQLNQLTEKKEATEGKKLAKEQEKAKKEDRLKEIPGQIEATSKNLELVNSADPYSTDDQFFKFSFKSENKILELNGIQSLRSEKLPKVDLADCNSFHKQYFLHMKPAEAPKPAENESSEETVTSEETIVAVP